MGDKYILLDDHTVREAELLEWARWFEDNPKKRVVKQDELPNGYWISTIFLGLDHSFGSGPPLIFETMAFKRGERLEEVDMNRYTTWDEAMEGHKKMVEWWEKKK